MLWDLRTNNKYNIFPITESNRWNFNSFWKKGNRLKHNEFKTGEMENNVEEGLQHGGKRQRPTG